MSRLSKKLSGKRKCRDFSPESLCVRDMTRSSQFISTYSQEKSSLTIGYLLALGQSLVVILVLGH